MPGRGLTLLSLDGGGVRGLSSLLILRRLMEKIKDTKGLEVEPKPCEYFDMIGGTSTGGLIAIMLGHLQMSVDECIQAYLELTRRVFTPIRARPISFGLSRGLGDVVSRFDSTALEEAIKKVVRGASLDQDALFYDESRASQCKVFVSALQSEITTPVLLTNYKSKRSDSDRRAAVKIWQAARATSAASGFFDAQEIRMPLGYLETYTDGATGYNNPIRQLWTEATEILLSEGEHLEDHLDAVVSIGTGIPALEAFGTSFRHIATALIRIATETENTAKQFQQDNKELERDGRYCRLSVANGLQSIGLEEYKRANTIMAATNAYLDHPDTVTKLTKCVERMSQHECLCEMNLANPPRIKEALLPFPKSTAKALDILDTISAYDHDEVQLSITSHRTPGTTQWLFESAQYRDWCSSLKSSFLLCTGPVGCGKTMLAASMVEHLLKQSRPVLYYFCTESSGEASSDTAMIFRSILKQTIVLCAQTKKTLSEQMVGRIEEAATLPSGSGIRELLMENLHHLSGAFIILDGLDALAGSQISELRDALLAITRKPSLKRLNVALFHRETLAQEPNLTSGLVDTIELSLSAELLERDIKALVSHELDRRQKLRKITDSDKMLEWIKTELISRGERMFLWIVLQLDSLWAAHTDAEIRSKMNHLPSALESTYNRCLEQIVQTEDPNCRQLAQRIMLWMVCAKRPLAVEEVRQLVVLEGRNEQVNPEQFLNQKPTEYCANLVILGPQGLEFAHFSVRQFLANSSKVRQELEWNDFSPDRANSWAGRLCGTYMKTHSRIAPERRKKINARDKVQAVVRELQAKPLGKIMMSIPPIARIEHSLRRARGSPTNPSSQPVHSTGSHDSAMILHRYIQENWLHHTVDMTTAEFREQFAEICLEDDSWLPWNSKGKYEVDHLRQLIKHAISTSHLSLLQLACDRVETLEKHRAVFGTPWGNNEPTPLSHAIIGGNLDIVDILLRYYDRHLCLGPTFDDAILQAARCNNEGLLRHFHTVLPRAMGKDSNINALFDLIVRDDNPALLHWWLFTFQGQRSPPKVSQQVFQAVLTICETQVERPTCFIPLLKEYVRIEAAPESIDALLARAEFIREPKDCLQIIVLLGKPDPVKLVLSRVHKLLTPMNMDCLAEAALALPIEDTLTMLELLFSQSSNPGEHWIKVAILGPANRFIRRPLPWLEQLFRALVSENGTSALGKVQIVTLLKLLEVLPDRTIVEMLDYNTDWVDDSLRDHWNHNILYALAHRPTAHALQALNVRNLLSRIDISAADDHGWCPLHVAATRGYNEVVIFLLLHGADPQRRNNQSDTPADLAQKNGLCSTRALLDRWENSSIGAHCRMYMEQQQSAPAPANRSANSRATSDSDWGLQLSVYRALDKLYEEAEDAGEPASSVTLTSLTGETPSTPPLSFPEDFAYYRRSQEVWIRQ